jgi:hypothetical protein
MPGTGDVQRRKGGLDSGRQAPPEIFRELDAETCLQSVFGCIGRRPYVRGKVLALPRYGEHERGNFSFLKETINSP